MKGSAKKLIISIFVAFLLLAPNAEAAWWNPFDWGSDLADWALSFIYNDSEGLAQNEIDAMRIALTRTNAILANGKMPGPDRQLGTADDVAFTQEDINNLNRVQADLNTRLSQQGQQDLINEYNQAYNNSIADQRAAATCSVDPATWPNCILWLVAWGFNITQYIFGVILYVVALVFDFSVYVSISEVFKTLIQSEGITKVWIIVRDLANILLVFSILWIAIGYAINSNSFNQKTIAKIVAVALLVNFSGFLTKVVIDASNVVAYEFYSRISPGDTTASSFGTKNLGVVLSSYLRLDKGILDENLNARPMNETSVPTISSFLSIISQFLGNIVLIMAFSFVLLVASLLFVIRAIVLIAVYVASPFAMISIITPIKPLQVFGSWKEKLIKQAFFAPAFLIPLYLVLLIVGDPSYGQIFNFSGLASEIFMQVILIGMVLGSIVIANTMGAVGSEFATNIASKANGMLTRTATAPIRAGGRYAGRKTGKYISDSRLGNWAKDSWNSGRLSTVRKSWDTGKLHELRTSKTAQSMKEFGKSPLTNTLNKTTGTIGGYVGAKNLKIVEGPDRQAQIDSKAKTIIEEMKGKVTDEEKVKYLEGLAGTFKGDELKAVYSKLSAEDRIKFENIAKRTSPQLATKMDTAKASLAGEDKAKTFAEQVKNSSPAEQVRSLESLSSTDLERVYSKLSAEDKAKLTSQITKEQASDPTAFAGLKSRLDSIKSRTAPSGSKQEKELAKAQNKQDKQVASDEARERIEQAIQSGLPPQTSDVRNILPGDITKLKTDTLKKVEVIDHLTPAQLAAIKSSDNPEHDQTLRDTIRQRIISQKVDPHIGGVPNPHQMPQEARLYHSWFERNADF